MKKEFKDQLKEWKRQQRLMNHHSRNKPQKRRSERLTESEIKDLMGMNMPVYRRGKGGAWRNVR